MKSAGMISRKKITQIVCLCLLSLLCLSAGIGPGPGPLASLEAQTDDLSECIASNVLLARLLPRDDCSRLHLLPTEVAWVLTARFSDSQAKLLGLTTRLRGGEQKTSGLPIADALMVSQNLVRSLP